MSPDKGFSDRTYGRLDALPLYRVFIYSFFSRHITLIVVSIAVGQLLIFLGLLFNKMWVDLHVSVELFSDWQSDLSASDQLFRRRFQWLSPFLFCSKNTNTILFGNETISAIKQMNLCEHEES